jgi:hypothetical protein
LFWNRHLRDAHDKGRKDERRDDHLDQAHEQVCHQREGIGRSLDAVGVREQLITRVSCGDSQDHTNHDPGRQFHSLH